jgi:hypothetical protein
MQENMDFKFQATKNGGKWRFDLIKAANTIALVGKLRFNQGKIDTHRYSD